MKAKPVIALAGGVASGKSAVAAAFGRLGALVVDADLEGHAVLGDPAVVQEIRAAFGEGAFTDGAVDRKKLGAIVFADGGKLATLNAITHPRIRQRTNAKIEAGLSDPGIAAIVLDISLLLESGAYGGKYSLLVFVESSDETRRKRAAQRGWDEGELDRRQSRQMKLEEKRRLADVVIDNNGSLADLDRQVQEIWHKYVP
ncbi:MAG: dephospho-CoA kinase [Planctomycetes bacterium]|nr:dephospho-CoA kinase [Planctomycetota bacterium]MCW8135285.1 dephospho-CoA kinase [Planctomycetota bacterium]